MKLVGKNVEREQLQSTENTIYLFNYKSSYFIF
jgi:hypothetical protein